MHWAVASSDSIHSSRVESWAVSLDRRHRFRSCGHNRKCGENKSVMMHSPLRALRSQSLTKDSNYLIAWRVDLMNFISLSTCWYLCWSVDNENNLFVNSWYIVVWPSFGMRNIILHHIIRLCYFSVDSLYCLFLLTISNYCGLLSYMNWLTICFIRIAFYLEQSNYLTHLGDLRRNCKAMQTTYLNLIIRSS